MAIAPTLAKYLATKNVAYDVLAHTPTQSALRTAPPATFPVAAWRRRSCSATSKATPSPCSPPRTISA